MAAARQTRDGGLPFWDASVLVVLGKCKGVSVYPDSQLG